jgi:hypothetical protein
MNLHSKSYSVSTASYTIVLADLAIDDVNSNALVRSIADFDIEVIGNDSIVALTAIGPFSNSGQFAVTDGSFAINGGKLKIEGFALGQLVFSRAGTTAYTINVIRRIQEK